MISISNEICVRIIDLSKGGNRELQIAAITKVSVRMVQRLVKIFREDGTYKHKACTRSHAKKLSERDVYSIVLYSKTHCRSSVSEIISICPTQV